MAAGSVMADDVPKAPGRTERSVSGAAAASLPRFPAWLVGVLAVFVVMRALCIALVVISEDWFTRPERSIPAWAQMLQAVLFWSVAFLLLYYGRDRRSRSLGVFILDVAATLQDPFARTVVETSLPASIAVSLPTSAFQAALLWFFASDFPQPARRPSLAKTFLVMTWSAFALGVAIAVVDVYARWSGTGELPLFVQSLRRNSEGVGDWFFTLQFLILIPLLFVMPLKLREAGPGDRRRFSWLMIGVIIGFAPLAVDVLLLTLWPWYAAASTEPAYARLVGGVIIVALTAVPVAGAYAALVQRTLDVRLVVRSALQYLFARSFLWGLTAVPFAGLLALIVLNRDQSVSQLAVGPTGVGLAGLAVTGVTAAIGRKRLQRWVDARFFREEIDARATLMSVADAARRSASIDDLREVLARALEMAFHPTELVTLVAGSDEHLHTLDADVPSLSRASAMAQLLASHDAPLDLDSRDAHLLGRLSTSDRAWLATSGATILVPLRGSTGALLGVAAMGQKKSELAYSDDDRALLAAAGSAAGLALDRILSSAAQAHVSRETEPAARECLECGTVLPPDRTDCPCGGLAQRACVPQELGRRYRFAQRVGTGGSAVVYRAFDTRLQQWRAVKTLPGTDPVLIARLRREARAMGTVHHPNLAGVHGFEVWRGSPLLIMEFLDGGTLAERLQRGPMALADALRLGVALADAVGALHQALMLHRDLKPSNIAFTARGVPKLLDFGLAKVVLRRVAPSLGGIVGDDPTVSMSLSTSPSVVQGTPAYLSPEVLAGAAPDVRDDLWSLGVTLLEASTGRNPFRDSSIAVTIARVLHERACVIEATQMLPPAAARLFTSLLGDVAERPQTARQLCDRLTQCLPGG